MKPKNSLAVNSALNTLLADANLLERCAEAVHKAYCNYYIKNKGEEYWTKGDYSLLDEPTKQIDRETVKAVFEILDEQLRLHFVVGQSEQLKCDCCNGTGMVEGEHYDDLQSCLTCNGRGYFNYPQHPIKRTTEKLF